MTRIPPDADRDFTGGCLVIDDGRLLLLDHTKLGLWLQPGGHVEPGETPDETAKRETREETGIDITFHPSHLPERSPDTSCNLPEPFQVNLHRIRDGHWHCSFLYLATVGQTGDASHADEHDGMKWFSPQELESEQYEIPENIRAAGTDAIETVASVR
ncbi:MAG: NUDIX domain-containing protein [Candidatus Nanohaloarchaea archaeon]|nr:NUDIX domain-containing protein [Candidatus Nanohaloarchaea archaeon]